MSCFTITVCALAFLGADEKLAPQARLECAGEVVGAALTPDGKTLFGVARNGGLYDLAAWGVPSGSKTVLARGTDGALIASSNDERSLLSPDGKSLAGFILDKHGKAYDVNVVAWEVPSMSKTPLFVMKGEKFVSLTGAFSPDGAVLAIPECNANAVRLWKRDAAAKWSVSRVLDAGQKANAKGPAAGYPFCAAFTPDRKQVFVLRYVCDERAKRWVWVVEKWDTTSGRRLAFPLQPIETVFPFGNLLVSADGGTLCVQTEDKLVSVAESFRLNFQRERACIKRTHPYPHGCSKTR